MDSERIDVIALQETHTKDNEDLSKRGYIKGYLLLGAIHHKQYGVATYIKEDIDTCQIIFRENQGDTQILSAQIGKVTVVNIYKPPQTKWRSPPIKVFEHPALYIGDFNSHNVDWGYDQNDDNGNKFQE